MRTLGKFIVPAFMLAFVASAAQAEVDPEMTVKLQKMYPKTKFNQVNKTPIPGITEVVMGNNIAYVEPDGRYFLFGKLYDMQAQVDMTTSRMEEIQKVDMSRLDKSLAFKRVRGDGSRTMYLFSDPDCPYCTRLEKSLVELDNVTIYTFMMPLKSMHPEAHGKSVSVWCAKDKVAAWNDMMLNNKAPAAAQCDHPIDKVVELAASMGVNGTPTMFTEDGRKMAGARDAAGLSAWLDGGAKKTASKE